MNKIEHINTHIASINEINILLKYNSIENDALVLFYHDLLKIIFYGNFDELITYSKTIYDINIKVSTYDVVGTRIKNFILLYLNDAIEETLIDYETESTR